MVDAFVDTSIVIDLLRGYQPSLDWIESNEEVLGITRYVWLEVIQGCANKQKQQLAVKMLQNFELQPITNEDAEWATKQLLTFHLKAGIDKIDCLIAAPCNRLQIPLYTRNLKHFRHVLNELARDPYPSTS